MSNFQIGDEVQWHVIRNNRPVGKPLIGKIIAVVPPYTSYLAALVHHLGQAFKLSAADIRKMFSFKYLGRHIQKEHTSYLVSGPSDGKPGNRPALYWPQVKHLQKLDHESN